MQVAIVAGPGCGHNIEIKYSRDENAIIEFLLETKFQLYACGTTRNSRMSAGSAWSFSKYEAFVVQLHLHIADPPMTVQRLLKMNARSLLRFQVSPYLGAHPTRILVPTYDSRNVYLNVTPKS